MGFISKLNGESGLAYRPTKTGTKVVEVQGQLSDLLDKQHTELVDKYTPEQLTTVATFFTGLASWALIRSFDTTQQKMTRYSGCSE
ncbi:hypothetical protein [Secundilactobacillus odoratitofui]|uniref:hypothetical protein n=1 Tax=Secundilactobacillus odoratitofui TaxID=480930 RepID=UPI0006D19212|nr:hypothetical protein [Secundilactobacillus odoratitofui]